MIRDPGGSQHIFELFPFVCVLFLFDQCKKINKIKDFFLKSKIFKRKEGREL